MNSDIFTKNLLNCFHKRKEEAGCVVFHGAGTGRMSGFGLETFLYHSLGSYLGTLFSLFQSELIITLGLFTFIEDYKTSKTPSKPPNPSFQLHFCKPVASGLSGLTGICETEVVFQNFRSLFVSLEACVSI